MTTPYRTAPAEQPAPKAPRASWWRRLWHRDLAGPLFIRRQRHALKQEFPRATWRDRHDLAVAEYDALHGARGDAVDSAVSELEARDIRERLRAQANLTAPSASARPIGSIVTPRGLEVTYQARGAEPATTPPPSATLRR